MGAVSAAVALAGPDDLAGAVDDERHGRTVPSCAQRAVLARDAAVVRQQGEREAGDAVGERLDGVTAGVADADELAAQAPQRVRSRTQLLQASERRPAPASG